MDDDLALLREMADAVAAVMRTAPPEQFGKTLGMGADGTSTKVIDDLAERAILSVLDKSGAALNFLSEEAGYLDRHAERVLVVDPIDGTTNAVRGIPFHCVSLAIGHKTLSDVEKGLVLNLATGERYEAVKGVGAWRNDDPIRVSTPSHGSEGNGMVVSTAITRHAAQAFPPGTVLRNFGASALEMCLVAQGALDAYHYPKPILRIIDVAASTLIVKEAGGHVVGRDGKDLDLPLSLVPRFGLTAAGTHDLATTLGGVSE